MPKAHVHLEILERIISAEDDHRLAEAALAGLREISPGDHFSAILFNPVTLAAEAFFAHQGWLPSGSDFRDAAGGKLIEHPLARKFLKRQEPMALLRSREVSDKEWRKSFIYNELDRPLGVEDIATVYPSGSEKVTTTMNFTIVAAKGIAGQRVCACSRSWTAARDGGLIESKIQTQKESRIRVHRKSEEDS
jgi:hypothetical protein